MMRIHNRLALLLECLGRWEKRPSEGQFDREFALPMAETVGDFFEGFHRALPTGRDWQEYREEALKLDPAREEGRLRGHIRQVEDLFGFPLSGDAILMGGFAEMDGYARFDKGSHTVYLAVDESHARGGYMDILMVHELTHAARESRPEVWEGFGLDPKMTQDEFTEHQPVVEHLMGEGFSCAVSELLVPGQPRWEYAYQSESSLSEVFDRSRSLDQAIHRELRHPDGDYGRLYRTRPIFAHYVWAWHWVKGLLRKYAAGDAKKLVARCSKEFIEDALAFELKDAG